MHNTSLWIWIWFAEQPWAYSKQNSLVWFDQWLCLTKICNLIAIWLDWRCYHLFIWTIHFWQTLFSNYIWLCVCLDLADFLKFLISIVFQIWFESICWRLYNGLWLWMADFWNDRPLLNFSVRNSDSLWLKDF